MGIRFGNWDPLALTFGMLDKLLRKNHITVEEAKEILTSALPPEMSTQEKTEIINSMIIKTPPSHE